MAKADQAVEATLAAEAPPTPRVKGKPRGKGASADRMRELTQLRMEKAKTDPKAKGGRPRIRYSKKEAEERALEKMVPKALRVLDVHLESEDERVQQAAAIKVLEYVKGKPTQRIEQTGDNVHTIVYQSAAWQPLPEIEGAEFRELEQGDTP